MNRENHVCNLNLSKDPQTLSREELATTIMRLLLCRNCLSEQVNRKKARLNIIQTPSLSFGGSDNSVIKLITDNLKKEISKLSTKREEVMKYVVTCSDIGISKMTFEERQSFEKFEESFERYMADQVFDPSLN